LQALKVIDLKGKGRLNGPTKQQRARRLMVRHPTESFFRKFWPESSDELICITITHPKSQHGPDVTQQRVLHFLWQLLEVLVRNHSVKAELPSFRENVRQGTR
jgi:hypothetical protein